MVIISPKTDHFSLAPPVCPPPLLICPTIHQNIIDQRLVISACLPCWPFITLYLLSPPVLSCCSTAPPHITKPLPNAVSVPYFLTFSHMITVASGIHRSCVPRKVSVSSWFSVDTAQGTHKNPLKYISKMEFGQFLCQYQSHWT